MKPPQLSYVRAATPDEAVRLLNAYGEDSKLLAGGQSLVPLLNLRLAQPSVLIDITPLQSLNFIREGPGGTIEIGALTRHRHLEQSALVARECPLLAAAASHIGNVPIRNRGTIGGSLAHADPAAELPLALLALGGEVVIRSAQGQRTTQASSFLLGLWETMLEPGDLVEFIRVQRMPAAAGWSFREVTHRAGDFAIAAAAVTLTLASTGRISSCAIALSGTGSQPIRLTDLEDRLVGSFPDDEMLSDAERHALNLRGYRTDPGVTSGYRQRIAADLVRTGLAHAARAAEPSGRHQ